MNVNRDTRCICLHVQEIHLHHRAGEDCSKCGKQICPQYRRNTWLNRKLFGRKMSQDRKLKAV